MKGLCSRCDSTERYANGHCKKCAREASARYYAENSESRKKVAKIYRDTFPEKCAAATRSWNEKNPGILRKYNRVKAGWLPGEHEKAEKARIIVESCGCCGCKTPPTKHGWVADNDNLTGLFRALICQHCNIVLGQIESYGLDKSPSVEKYLAHFSGH